MSCHAAYDVAAPDVGPLIHRSQASPIRRKLSYRDIEELLLERGLEVDHSTVNRWVLATHR